MSDYLSRAEYDKLSIASKDLVRQVGGDARALEITGYSQGAQIRRCTTVAGIDRRYFTVKAVAELESDAAESGFVPPVTKALADLAGFDLVRRERCKGEASALAAIPPLMKAFAEASSSVMNAYADGVLTTDEQAECIGRLEALSDETAKALAILRGEKVEGNQE